MAIKLTESGLVQQFAYEQEQPWARKVRPVRTQDRKVRHERHVRRAAAVDDTLGHQRNDWRIG